MNDNPAPIVVGLNDTSASRAALRFALREAARRDSTVEVVTAWSWRSMSDLPEPDDPREWARAHAQAVQDAAVAAVLSDFEGSSRMSRQVIEGDAAQVLLRVARDADYLVVGTGRKGPMRRILLGSVSEQCVRHAPCPVLVVPPPTGSSDSEALMSSVQASLL